MPTKKEITIIALLGLISLGLGYWYGLPDKPSGERAETGAPPVLTVVTNIVTNIVAANPQPTPTPAPVKPQLTRNPNAERTIKGDLKCAKCALKKTEICQAALEITRKNKQGKETTLVILLKNDDVTRAFHKEICKATVFSAITGKFEGEGKERVLVASKIVKAQEKKK